MHDGHTSAEDVSNGQDELLAEQGQQSFLAWLGAQLIARFGRFFALPGAVFSFGKQLAVNFLAPFKNALAATASFTKSRRWLLGALALTGVLVGIVAWTRQDSRRPFLPFNQEPSVVFGEIKRLPPRQKNSDSPPGSTSAPTNHFPETVAAPLTETPAPMRLSRRLDIVRFRQARGAWLVGKIEDAATEALPTSHAPVVSRKAMLDQEGLKQRTALPVHASAPPMPGTSLQ